MRVVYLPITLALALGVSCASGGKLKPFMSFDETPLNDNSSTMTFKLDESRRSVVEKSMIIMCECTRLTVERGFRYFYIDKRERTENWGSFRVTFFNSPPQGIPVVTMTDPGDLTKGPDPMTSAIDTEELTRLCNR